MFLRNISLHTEYFFNKILTIFTLYLWQSNNRFTNREYHIFFKQNFKILRQKSIDMLIFDDNLTKKKKNNRQLLMLQYLYNIT